MDDLRSMCAKRLGIRDRDVRDIKIIKQSVDARSKPDLYYSYIVDVKVIDEKSVLFKNRNKKDIFYVNKNIDKYKFNAKGNKKIS